MLVKFLSYAASVVGSARHRAVLASCLVLIVAFAGILSIPFMHKAPEIKVVGSAQEEETDTDTDSEHVWLSEHRLPERDPKETNAPAEPKPTENTSEQSSSSNGTPANNEPGESAAELSLSKTELAIQPGAISDEVFARINNANQSDVTWSITTEKSVPANDITIISGEQIDYTTSFRIRVGSDAKAGTYQITVTAKSADFNLTKTITVTIQ